MAYSVQSAYTLRVRPGRLLGETLPEVDERVFSRVEIRYTNGWDAIVSVEGKETRKSETSRSKICSPPWRRNGGPDLRGLAQATSRPVSLHALFFFILLRDLLDSDPPFGERLPHRLPTGVNRHLLIGIGEVALDGPLRQHK
jgi:hypothetical protein